MIKSKKIKSERDILVEEIQNVQKSIEEARTRFNHATEQELVEQCVFEINALQARYAYFLRMVRELDGYERPIAL